jgi:thiamine pyrophosphokinase
MGIHVAARQQMQNSGIFPIGEEKQLETKEEKWSLKRSSRGISL